MARYWIGYVPTEPWKFSKGKDQSPHLPIRVCEKRDWFRYWICKASFATVAEAMRAAEARDRSSRKCGVSRADWEA